MQSYKISSEICSQNKNYILDDETYRQKIKDIKHQHVLEHKETKKDPKINFHDSLPFIIHKLPVSSCKKLENTNNVKSLFKKSLKQNCSQSEEKKTTTILENAAVGPSKPLIDISTLLNDPNIFQNRSAVTVWNGIVKQKPNRDAANLVKVCAKHRKQYSRQSKEHKEHKEQHIGFTTECKNQRSTQKSLQCENNSTQVSFVEKI
ncbi:uncharacterized protein [Diabrotica undecimpunctata]|uniref:uncharacterized protein isoform X1 n=2 Tax=Diabrotica undecimpunctata TaxID=50387 RepID=UPI003B638789